jgi:hypothetical protein
VWQRRADLDAMLASGEEPFARRLIRSAGHPRVVALRGHRPGDERNGLIDRVSSADDGSSEREKPQL